MTSQDTQPTCEPGPPTSGQSASGADAASAAELRGRRVLIATIAVYGVVLVAVVASGSIAFLPKEILLPLLFVPPALAGQFGVFWADWGRLLGLIVLFDALRGLVYACVTAFGWPVYMGYAITGDRWLLGGETGPEWLQSQLYSGVGLLEQALTLVHASHFAVFFVFGLLVWHWRRDAFPRFERGLVGVLFVGVLGYALVPTVPPWMADRVFGVIPPLARPIMETYNAVVPNVVSQFDTNPIAAMPSLHCAIPTFMSLVAARAFGWKAWPIFLYTAAVYFGVVYGGEHYVVDVVAGVALALAADAWAGRAGDGRRRADADQRDAATTGDADEVGRASVDDAADAGRAARARATLAFGTLLAASALVASTSLAWRTEWVPGEAFTERELVGRSPTAPYYQALHAFARGDLAIASSLLDTLPHPRRFDRLARLRVEVLLARGEPGAALDVLARTAPDAATASEHAYWQAYAHGRAGTLSEALWRRTLAQLERDRAHAGPQWAARLVAARQADFAP